MRKPYINQYNRQLVYLDTTSGAFIILDLRFKQLGRSILNDKPLMLFLMFGYPIIYVIVSIINQ